MRTLRLVLRSAALAGVNGALVAATLAVLPLALAIGRGEAWRARMLSVWARANAAILGMEVVVRGRPPARPFALVANHLSYLDIVSIGSRTPCAFVSKAEVARWPILGLLARLGGTIFVDRARKRDLVEVGDAIARKLEGGTGVVLFPEGTSSSGSGLLPFRSSLLEPFARRALPVHAASIRYEARPGAAPASTALCWWGEMGFGGHLVGVLRSPGFRVELDFAPDPIAAGDRKTLARELRAAVARRFRPVEQGAPSGCTVPTLSSPTT